MSVEHKLNGNGQQTDLERALGTHDSAGQPLGRQISVQLSAEQFEKLYLQPGGNQAKGDLTKRFGNPTTLGVGAFLLCLTPVSCFFMGLGGSTANSAIVMTGAFFCIGGIGQFTAGILEFFLGNTFPFVVFTTFGTYWFAFGFIVSPHENLAGAFGGEGGAAAGAATAPYNAGVAFYLIFWAVLVFIYLIGSLRTNVVFVLLFFTLDMGFFLVIAGYFAVGSGNAARIAKSGNLFKAGGAFLFCTSLCGWWLMFVLICASTGVPFTLPVGDLSGFMSGGSANTGAH